MNDLDLLRELRAEIPYPERPRLAPGRSRLLAEARRTPRGRFARGRRGVLMLTAGVAAAAVVGGVAGYGLIAGSRPAPAPTASKAVPAARRAGQRSQRSGYHRFLKIRYSTRSTRMPATISKL
jgi:hypothetical protein